MVDVQTYPKVNKVEGKIWLGGRGGDCGWLVSARFLLVVWQHLGANLGMPPGKTHEIQLPNLVNPSPEMVPCRFLRFRPINWHDSSTLPRAGGNCLLVLFPDSVGLYSTLECPGLAVDKKPHFLETPVLRPGF